MFKNLSPEAYGISGRESEIIELALSHGFKGFDLDLIDFADQVKTQGFAKASRLIVSARLKIGSFRVPVRWEEETSDYRGDLERLRSLAEIAQQMGCTRAVTTIEPGSQLRPYHENFEYHRRKVAEIADVLAPFKIRLALGFLAPIACRAGCRFQFVQTVDEMLLLFSTINASNVGIAFDAWDWHLGGGRLEQLKTLAPGKIITASLAQVDAGATAANAAIDSRRSPADSGAIDLAAVLMTLAELGYDGPVTPAPDKTQLAGLSRDRIVKHAGAALDSLWKAAGLNAAGKLATVRGR